MFKCQLANKQNQQGIIQLTRGFFPSLYDCFCMTLVKEIYKCFCIYFIKG